MIKLPLVKPERRREYPVARIPIHENHDLFTRANDIGLIKLTDEIPFDTKINRILIAPPDEQGWNRERLHFAGWGSTKVNIYFSNILCYVLITKTIAQLLQYIRFSQ